MVYGLLCGLSTMERLPDAFFGMEEDCFTRVKQIATRFLGLIISIILIITTTIILLQGDGETAPCPNCMWLSCVPFPPWKPQGDKWWYCDDCGRVSAEIVEKPSLHLQLDCPGGTSVAVGLETETADREKLEDELPAYCREFCSDSFLFSIDQPIFWAQPPSCPLGPRGPIDMPMMCPDILDKHPTY